MKKLSLAIIELRYWKAQFTEELDSSNTIMQFCTLYAHCCFHFFLSSPSKQKIYKKKYVTIWNENVIGINEMKMKTNIASCFCVYVYKKKQLLYLLQLFFSSLFLHISYFTVTKCTIVYKHAHGIELNRVRNVVSKLRLLHLIRCDEGNLTL